MRAAVFHRPGEKLRIETLPDPRPGPREVVVKVGRCGICGTDLHITEAAAGRMCLPAGAVPGHEFAGEVVEIGAEVSALRLGDHVAVMPFIGCGTCRACLSGTPDQCRSVRNSGMGEEPGGYAQFARAGAESCVVLPRAVGLAAGALVEPMAVALHGVRAANLQHGDTVLVIGAGPIGLATIYWAARAGARVIATARSNARAALARAMGAQDFILPEPGQSLARAARGALGAAPDVVFECVGLPGLIETSIACVRRRGLVVVLGFCVAADRLSPAVAVMKEVRLAFSFIYDRREFEIAADALARAEAPGPQAMITEVVGLDAAPDAFEALRARTHQCKVQIAPWD